MKKVVISVAIGIILIAGIIVGGQMFRVRFVNVEFDNSVNITDEQSILSLADISTNTNIFMIDEEAIQKRIENGYDNRAVKVTDIIREFPNKVTIRVSERIALFKINVHTDTTDGYVGVDRNFQRNNVYSHDYIYNDLLINVSGITLGKSFRTKECYLLQSIANSLIKSGIQEEALVYFINSIEFEEENRLIINLRTTNSKFILDDIYSQEVPISAKMTSLINQYKNLDMDKRDGITLFP